MNDQKLYKLCRDRDQLTPEIHAPNDFYGHAWILKSYAGVNTLCSIKAGLEHGITMKRNVWDVDLDIPFTTYLCASEIAAKRYNSLASDGRTAIPIGPMIRYAEAIVGPISESTERVLLVFPSHSTHHMTVKFDEGAFFDRLKEIQRDFDRTIVCVYWKNVLNGMAKRFSDVGWECVSAGHIFDVRFLLRLVHILKMGSVIYTNDIGSHILYAALLGKPVWLELDAKERMVNDRKYEGEVINYGRNEEANGVVKLFSEFHQSPTIEQIKHVEKVAGASHFKTKDEMQRIILDCEREYIDAGGYHAKYRSYITSTKYVVRRIHADWHKWLSKTG